MIPEKNSDKYVKQCELNLSRRVDHLDPFQQGSKAMALPMLMAFGHVEMYARS